MTEREFQERLGELLDQIQALPRQQREPLERLADETRARHEQMRQTIGSLQESLDYLRLSVKYLVFDLEATRRENQTLRSLLESRHDSRGEDGQG